MISPGLSSVEPLIETLLCLLIAQMSLALWEELDGHILWHKLRKANNLIAIDDLPLYIPIDENSNSGSRLEKEKNIIAENCSSYGQRKMGSYGEEQNDRVSSVVFRVSNFRQPFLGRSEKVNRQIKKSVGRSSVRWLSR